MLETRLLAVAKGKRVQSEPTMAQGPAISEVYCLATAMDVN